MSEEKKKVGRPRKYETRSERQKAYHERKKQKMTELEEEVKKLEKQTVFTSEIIGIQSRNDIRYNFKKATMQLITIQEVKRSKNPITHKAITFSELIENIENR